MALILDSGVHLVTCINREIVIFNKKNQTHTKTVIPTYVKMIEKPAGGEEQDSDNENKTKVTVSNQIHQASLSPCGELLALTTFGDKLLFLYKLQQDDQLELLGKQEIQRTSSALRFSGDSKHLLVADKTGDCYVLNCDQPVDRVQWMLGHLSIVLDCLWAPDKRYASLRKWFQTFKFSSKIFHFDPDSS